MKKDFFDKVNKLYPGYTNIYGPYSRKDNVKIVIFYDGKKRIGKQYSTLKFEVYVLRRRLTSGEKVIHIDNDYKNCKLSNLKVVYVGSKKQTDVNRFRSYSINNKNQISLLTDEDYYKIPKFRRRYHYYSFCFILPVFYKLEVFSFIYGLNNKEINAKIIRKLKKKHKTPKQAQLLSAVYLGYMNRNKIRENGDYKIEESGDSLEDIERKKLYKKYNLKKSKYNINIRGRE